MKKDLGIPKSQPCLLIRENIIFRKMCEFNQTMNFFKSIFTICLKNII